MVKIDPKNRVKMGIEELDGMLSGGLIRNTVSLITGPPGAGKTSIALSFVNEGARNGENCLYISLEEEMEGIMAGAKSIGLKNFQKHLDDRKIVIFDVGKMRVEGEFEEILNIENILKHIQTLSLGAEFSFSRIVIDSISAMMPNYPSVGELRKALFHLFASLRDRRLTVLAITEIESRERISMFDEAYLADTIIRLAWNPKLTDKAIYTILIPKMRYSAKSDGEFQYRITDEGVKINVQSQVW